MNTFSDQVFTAPELLFKPELNGIKSDSIPKTIYETIMKSNIENKNELFSNIVISGEMTLLKGFPERLEKEISDLAPSANVKISLPPKKQHITCKGAAEEFKQMLITRKEYDENGPEIINMKCPMIECSKL